MVRPGTIIGLATGVLLLGAAGAGLWYWSNQSAPGAPAGVAAVSTSGSETDSALARHVRNLHDSLQAVDSALREAQIVEAEVPLELVQRQAGLWERYTWARTRLSEALDASAPGATAAPAGGASPEPPAVAAQGSELASMLGSLATYLWILAGVGALAVGVLAWLLLFRRPSNPSSVRPLTEPTMRMDRNVRIPVRGDDTMDSPRREATFTQMRQARGAAPQDEYDDVPAAPLPRTGRHAWENTVSQPQPQMAPNEPTAVQDYVVSMAKRGRTPAEIARRLRIPQDQVDLILKLRRNA